MKISVVMASFLGEYKGCAKNREDKFVRAVNSFLFNDYPNKELIIVGDACKKTASLLKQKFIKELASGEIKFHNFWFKKKLFSGKLRTKGINMATGDYIIYLDSDDMFGESHISCIAEQIKMTRYDWGYYTDYIYSDKGLVPKNVEVAKDSIGTSSIFHKNIPNVINWKKCNGYGHDFMFVKKLMAYSDNYGKIYGGTYIICHIPNLIDN